MKKIRIFLSFIFLALLTGYIYTFHFNVLKIICEPVSKIIHKTPEYEDPYMQDRRETSANLERLETFWQRRIDASDNKDFYLVVDLQDSMLWLDINGINVHEGKITRYELSPDLLVRRDTKEIHAWLRNSFFLEEQWATIPKYPIRTRDITGNGAGPDSIDFRSFGFDSTDIFAVFSYSGSFKIGLRQADPVNTINPYLYKQISINSDDLDLPLVSTDSLDYTRLLEGEWISITAAHSDIIAVYRALDLKSQLVIGI